MIEIGKRYLFMTLSFYWEGIVVEKTHTHACVENATMVKDVGEHPEFDHARWPSAEKTTRRVWVALGGTHVLEL